MGPLTRVFIHQETDHIEGDYRCACKKCVARFGDTKVITKQTPIGVDWGAEPPITEFGKMAQMEEMNAQVIFDLRMLKDDGGRRIKVFYHPRGDSNAPFMAWSISRPVKQLPAEMILWLN